MEISPAGRRRKNTSISKEDKRSSVEGESQHRMERMKAEACSRLVDVRRLR